MAIPFVDLQAQYLSIKEEIDKAIHSVINGGSFIGGKVVSNFEHAFAEYIGVDHCIGCANGTDALEIALNALDIGAGDEVIVPALTWISTAEAVSNVGATPVFVDVLETERTIDPFQIEERLSPKTKAIIPVHLYGLPARMNELLSIAQKHNLKIVEDCAQAHGASIAGRKVGTFGDIATFSFYPTKNLGAYGDGGAILTRDEVLAEKCRRLTNHGQIDKHDHQALGRNSRLDTIQATILRVKLTHLDSWNEKRKMFAEAYDERLDQVLKPFVPNEYNHVFHLFVIQSTERDRLKDALQKHDIASLIHYPNPLPFLKPFDHLGYENGDFPVAEKLCREVLSLPIYSEMENSMVEKVCEIINFEAT